MLANTDVEVLSDNLGIDIVPLTRSDKIIAAKQNNHTSSPLRKEKSATATNSQKMLASFGLGLGVGAMAVIFGRRN